MAVFYRILLLFTMMIIVPSRIWSRDLSGMAVLVEGTVPGEGLPGFLPNRIPALSGRYELEGGASVSVWAITAPLVFDTGRWREKASGKSRLWYCATEDGKQVWCVNRTIPVRDGLGEYAKVVFMICTDADVSEKSCLSFLDAFAERTEFFFSSASHVADLSFPATLVMAGK